MGTCRGPCFKLLHRPCCWLEDIAVLSYCVHKDLDKKQSSSVERPGVPFTPASEQASISQAWSEAPEVALVLVPHIPLDLAHGYVMQQKPQTTSAPNRSQSSNAPMQGPGPHLLRCGPACVRVGSSSKTAVRRLDLNMKGFGHSRGHCSVRRFGEPSSRQRKIATVLLGDSAALRWEYLARFSPKPLSHVGNFSPMLL